MKRFRVCDLLLLTLLMLLGCSGYQRDRESGPSSQYETPMQLEGGLIQLPVSVNGAPPQPFILDTGLSGMIISQPYSDQVGAILSGKTVDLTGIGKTVTTVDVVRNLLVEVGGLQWAIGGAMVMPEPLSKSITEIRGQAFHGMLGAPFFATHAITIDFQERQLKLAPAQSFKYTGPGERLKLSLKERKPYIKAVVQQTPDSSPIQGEFLLDLGSNQALDLRGAFDSTLTQDLPQRIASGVGGDVQNPVGRVHSITFGDYVIRNPVTAFERSQNASPRRLSGRIGTQVLSQFKIILNYSKKEVILEPISPTSSYIDADMSGLRLISKQQGLESNIIVDFVYPSTPAQEVGMQKGDRLLEIDDNPIGKYSLHSLREQLIGAPDTIKRLKVERQTKIFNVKLILRPLI